MTEYESPLMRDLQKLMPSILIGLILTISIFIIFLVPFHLTVHGHEWQCTKNYTIAKWILDSVMMNC